jgi:hypothetical protein
MPNPLNTPENRQAIKELGRTLRQPTRGFNAWLNMIVGEKTYQNMRDLQEQPTRFLPDRVYRLNIADPAHDDR